MLFLVEVCEKSSFLKSVYFIKELIKIACLLIPIGLIIMLSIDFMKNIISKEEDMNKNLRLSIKRIIYCITIFMIPTIVNVSVSLLNNTNISTVYNECLSNANIEIIKSFEEYEDYDNEEEYTKAAPTDPDSNKTIVAKGSNKSTNKTSNNNEKEADYSDITSTGAQRILDIAEKFYKSVENDKRYWRHCSQEGNKKPCTSCCQLVKKILVQAGYQSKNSQMICHNGSSYKPTHLDNLSDKKFYKYKNKKVSDLKKGDIVIYSKPDSSSGNIAIFAYKKNGNYYYYGASSGNEIRNKTHPRKSNYFNNNGRNGKLYILRVKN